MVPQQLQERTLEFALQVYRFARRLMGDVATRHVAQQLLRAATSVAANYRAACLARSRKEWTAKLGMIREEADEVLFWLIFVSRSGMSTDSGSTLGALTDEAGQLARIFASAYRTSKERLRKTHHGPQMSSQIDQ